MMLTLGIYVRRGQRTLRRWMADPKIHTLLQCAAYLLGGFLLSAASLANFCQPLALAALCALSGWPALLLAAGGRNNVTVTLDPEHPEAWLERFSKTRFRLKGSNCQEYLVYMDIEDEPLTVYPIVNRP